LRLSQLSGPIPRPNGRWLLSVQLPPLVGEGMAEPWSAPLRHIFLHKIARPPSRPRPRTSPRAVRRRAWAFIASDERGKMKSEQTPGSPEVNGRVRGLPLELVSSLALVVSRYSRGTVWASRRACRVPPPAAGGAHSRALAASATFILATPRRAGPCEISTPSSTPTQVRPTVRG